MEQEINNQLEVASHLAILSQYLQEEETSKVMEDHLDHQEDHLMEAHQEEVVEAHQEVVVETLEEMLLDGPLGVRDT